MANQPSCPGCGTQLKYVLLARGDTPPWKCATCWRGWWPAELDPRARSSWDPRTRTHGTSPVAQEIRDNVARDARHRRGVSLLPEQVPLLTDSELQLLARLEGASPEMRQRAEQVQRDRERGAS